MSDSTARRATRRRLLGLCLGVVALAGLSIASASQLDTAPGTLQAGTATVASCQPADQPIRIGFDTTFSSGQYRADAVRLSGVSSDCNGETYRVRLLGPDGAALPGVSEVSGTVSVPGPSGTVSASIPENPGAPAIGAVAVAIG